MDKDKLLTGHRNTMQGIRLLEEAEENEKKRQELIRNPPTTYTFTSEEMLKALEEGMTGYRAAFDSRVDVRNIIPRLLLGALIRSKSPTGFEGMTEEEVAKVKDMAWEAAFAGRNPRHG